MIGELPSIKPHPPIAWEDSAIVAALITGVILIIVSLLNYFLPHIFDGFLSRRNRREFLEGNWKSSWGPHDGKKVLKHHELLKIYKHRGCDIWAKATSVEEPGKEWEVRGRFEKKYLQLIYYPVKTRNSPNFLDYGCYFVEQLANGDFEGISIGFGKNDDGLGEGIFTDYHYLESPNR